MIENRENSLQRFLLKKASTIYLYTNIYRLSGHLKNNNKLSSNNICSRLMAFTHLYQHLLNYKIWFRLKSSWTFLQLKRIRLAMQFIWLWYHEYQRQINLMTILLCATNTSNTAAQVDVPLWTWAHRKQRKGRGNSFPHLVSKQAYFIFESPLLK